MEQRMYARWKHQSARVVRLQAAALLLALTACGGGGGGDGGGNNGGGGLGTYTPGIFQPSPSFAARCAAPRSGTNPATGRAYPDVTGSTTDQNNWVRSWTNELYLWYREAPDLNPALYATPAYFDLLKTSATTPTGRPKDRFHFTYPTDEWFALSQSGQEVGYGLQWALISTDKLPRRAVIAYLEPSPPAATTSAGLSRGVEVVTVDGVDLANDNTQAGVAKINAGLFPSAAGESHAFVVRELNGSTRTVNLQAAVITTSPVPTTKVLQTADGPVGYLLFNDHLATSEAALYNAITTLKAASVTDLMLDIRYNGGGYLDIATAGLHDRRHRARRATFERCSSTTNTRTRTR
jgi:hypothetical protein